MKSKAIIVMFAALGLSACERKNAAILNELRLIEKTEKDTTQSEYIRESAAIFGKILKRESNVSKNDWIRADDELMAYRNVTTITTYVAFLKGLEKALPENLPQLKHYKLLEDRISKSKFVEFNVAWTVQMIGESIKEISLYGDSDADMEVERILKRFTEKHSNSETGKKILEFLNMVHQQGLQAQAKGIKPWESPRRSGTGGLYETVD